MARQVPRRPAGFDYGYRPAWYFSNLDSKTVVLASILGEERRRDVEERLASGDFDPTVWGEWLTESKLDDDIRTMFGDAHPGLMGGEYLPPLEDGQIEIARIVYASVTQDVTSIRARRCGKRIRYAIVDENEYVYTASRLSSTKPLTLGQLIRLINRSHPAEEDGFDNGLVFSFLENIIAYGGDADSMRHFIRVESAFYPELGRCYEEAIERYFNKHYPADALIPDEIGEIVDWVCEGKTEPAPSWAIEEFERWALARGWTDQNLVWAAWRVVAKDLEPDWESDDRFYDHLEQPMPADLARFIERREPLPVEWRPVVAAAFRRFLVRHPQVAFNSYGLPDFIVSRLTHREKEKSIYVVSNTTGLPSSRKQSINGYYATLRKAKAALRAFARPCEGDKKAA